MRVVTINHGLQKARDTSRIYELMLFDGAERVTIADDANVIVKVGNSTGFLLDIEPAIVDGKIQIAQLTARVSALEGGEKENV